MNYYYTIIPTPEYLQTYHRTLNSEFVPVLEIEEFMENDKIVYELSCPQLDKYAQFYSFSI